MQNRERVERWLKTLPHKGERPLYYDGDYYCSVCGEPWSVKSVKEDMGEEWYRKFMKGLGCPVCKGKRKEEGKNMKVADRVVKASKLLEKLFLEQDVGDLGEIPAEPEALVTIGDVENEVAGEELQDIVQQIQDKGVEAEPLVEEDGIGFVVKLEDGRELSFMFDILDGEPILSVWTEEGRVTVSLAPLIGYVDSVPTAVEKIAGDEEVVDEFVDFVVDVVGERGDFEELIEEPGLGVEAEGEELGGKEDDEMELEGGIEEEEEIPLESRKERRIGLLRKRKEMQEVIGPSGKEEEERRIEIPPGGKVEYEQIDVQKGELAGRVLQRMAQPSYTSKFQPREGQPDIVSFVTKEEEK